MDLTQTFPRSPKEKFAGLVHAPRMVDKALAYKNKRLGEYIYPCPLDKVILDFLGIKEKQFTKVAVENGDAGILDLVEQKCRDRSPEKIEAVNQQILQRQPKNEKRWKDFYEMRDKIDPTRTDINTWVGLIDLEEGRL
ncbi:MAG: DUF5069 domain-containing protein [Nitrospinales bacterium]